MNAQEFPKDFPTLETKRLVLRKLEAADAGALFENYSDEEIAKNFMEEPLRDIKQASQFIEAFDEEFAQGKAITWGIVLKKTAEMIGTCSCMLKSNSCAEIGYDLAKAQWGKGLMAEALEAMIGYGFDEMGLETIKVDTLSSNSRSINLLKRLAFQLDGVRGGSHFFTRSKKDIRNYGTS